jgi:hypothetical protein
MFVNDLTGFGRTAVLHGNFGFAQPLFNQGTTGHIACQQVPYFANQQAWSYGNQPFFGNQPLFGNQIPVYGNQIGQQLHGYAQPMINPFWSSFVGQPVQPIFNSGWNANVGHPVLGYNTNLGYTNYGVPYGRPCF